MDYLLLVGDPFRVSYSKPFKSTLCVLFAFVCFVSLRKSTFASLFNLKSWIAVVSLRLPLGDFHQGITSHWSVIPWGYLTQSLSKECCASFWLLYFMSTPASKLARFLKIQKPVTFVTGFVIRIGFEPMALILEG